MAEDQHVSMAGLIRTAVTRFCEASSVQDVEQRYARAASAAGACASGRGNLSADHDAYFAEASALLAVLDRDDERHAEAEGTWQRLMAERSALLTTNYVLLETVAILQSRIGM
jgi:hypothetical protein